MVESVVDYGGGRVMHGVALLEFKDGKVWRDPMYFAEPFDASKWRAHLVERMEEAWEHPALSPHPGVSSLHIQPYF